MSRKKAEQGSLKDRLNEELLSQMKTKKKALAEAEEKRKEEEKQKRIEEKKRREANKSFEELLNESDMDWKKFKS